MKMNSVSSIAMKLAIFVALSGVAPTAAFVNLRRAGTPLPPSDEARLRKVEDGVNSLQAPPHPDQVSSSAAAQQTIAASDCSLLGGLITAKISRKCCMNAQVVTQRQLKQYGMAQKCAVGWQCEADGMTPLPTFEKQSLSSMCGEPGCLPAVVAAFKRNPVTKKGAKEMSGICSTLASLGGDSASPEAVSKVLTGASGLSDKMKEKCTADYCKDDGAKDAFCGKMKTLKKKGKEAQEQAQQTISGKLKERCFDHCCKSGGVACFPGEAMVHGPSGEVPMSALKTQDLVLVESNGELVYEPVLAFLHRIGKNARDSVPFLTVTHVNGQFRASATHIVFVTTDPEGRARTSKTVNKLQVGDLVFAAVSSRATPSRVLSIHQSSTQSGMYAPLTASGTIVVDGVVASNYASSSENKHLPHYLAHALFFPVRLYHYFGLDSRLKDMWKRKCLSTTTTKSWFCQGGHFPEGEAEAETEEMHPYARVMWKGFKMDLLLASQ